MYFLCRLFILSSSCRPKKADSASSPPDSASSRPDQQHTTQKAEKGSKSDIKKRKDP